MDPFARLRLWKIESRRTTLFFFFFFFIAQRDICGGYRVTLNRSRSTTDISSLPPQHLLHLPGFPTSTAAREKQSSNQNGATNIHSGRQPQSGPPHLTELLQILPVLLQTARTAKVKTWAIIYNQFNNLILVTLLTGYKRPRVLGNSEFSGRWVGTRLWTLQKQWRKPAVLTVRLSLSNCMIRVLSL